MLKGFLSFAVGVLVLVACYAAADVYCDRDAAKHGAEPGWGTCLDRTADRMTGAATPPDPSAAPKAAGNATATPAATPTATPTATPAPAGAAR